MCRVPLPDRGQTGHSRQVVTGFALNSVKKIVVSLAQPTPLKKVFAIILLFVFLFNVGGYYIVFWGISFGLDQRLNSRLDANQYSKEETVELKIPMTLPYPIQSNGFERVDGRFEHNGEFFKLIKHKLQDDTLYVVCIRDHDTRSLVATLNSYVENALGLTTTNKKALNLVSKLIKDYFSEGSISVDRWNVSVVDLVFAHTTHLFSQLEMPVHAPPPRI